MQTVAQNISRVLCADFRSAKAAAVYRYTTPSIYVYSTVIFIVKLFNSL